LEKLQRTNNIVAPERIQHKLKYFSFCRIFEKLYNIYAEILIKVSQPYIERLFIILYSHYLPKISELKNQVPKLRFII
jgi:hypothetical protein